MSHRRKCDQQSILCPIGRYVEDWQYLPQSEGRRPQAFYARAMNSSVINFFKNGGKTRSATKTFDTLLISGECRANFSLVFDAVLFFRTVILCVWL